ncbi:putative membrane protein [Lutibacter oceani]|uniref:Putative membrane protein n=1 Tax=Lutibacter oceani TaxID=1853311 RepID=A0A3D9RRD3_9FLAO|nr:putative membrane protein [Lutibacter oceani]
MQLSIYINVSNNNDKILKASIKNRIQSLDFLKGIVLILMALDHTRDFFHNDAFSINPTDPNTADWFVFITRWITHFCAPVFCFLAGISAFLISRKKTKNQLAKFLLKRGIWLIFIELTLVNFAWNFDIYFTYNELAVIWSLGMSMVLLAGIIYLPKNIILLISVILIFGHNLLDSLNFNESFLWSLVHQENGVNIFGGRRLYVSYPIIPWVGVMSLGFWFGALYNKTVDVKFRKKALNILGVSLIALFIILRYSNYYGDLNQWQGYNNISKTLMSFMATTKYPPSLLFLLMTLGPSFLFLANTEKLKGKVVSFFQTFGRVPFFYYILHLYLIHFLAGIMAKLTGFGWTMMVLPKWVTDMEELKGYGFNLWIVYVVWIFIILLLYPLCKKFDKYKMNNKDKKWLSYL